MATEVKVQFNKGEWGGGKGYIAFDGADIVAYIGKQTGGGYAVYGSDKQARFYDLPRLADAKDLVVRHHGAGWLEPLGTEEPTADGEVKGE